MTKNWTIVGKDLLSVVSCTEPYEWKDPTISEWEFSEQAKQAAAGKRFKVRPWGWPAAVTMGRGGSRAWRRGQKDGAQMVNSRATVGSGATQVWGSLS